MLGPALRGDDKYAGSGVLAPNGKIYFAPMNPVPHSSTNITGTAATSTDLAPDDDVITRFPQPG